jgi:hypothetical protein
MSHPRSSINSFQRDCSLEILQHILYGKSLKKLNHSFDYCSLSFLDKISTNFRNQFYTKKRKQRKQNESSMARKNMTKKNELFLTSADDENFVSRRQRMSMSLCNGATIKSGEDDDYRRQNINTFMGI